MYHVEVWSGVLVALSAAAQAFRGLVPVWSVPLKSSHVISNPSPLSLLKVKLELPGIVFVIFVQVSALNEPVSVTYLCDVPSSFLKVL